MADVRGGIGPFLSVYLLATRHWDAASIGVVMSVMGAATVLAQSPAGVLIDRTRRKRLLVVFASLIIGLCCIATTRLANGIALGAVQAVTGVAEAFFAPAIAAISLGLVGHRYLSFRIGRTRP